MNSMNKLNNNTPNTDVSSRQKSNALRSKYYGYVPVIVEKKEKSKDTTFMKFLVPSDMTFSCFISVMRKKMDLQPQKALFVFTKENMFPKASDLMLEIDKKNKGDDGFLRLYAAEEETFG
jgi:GABA(A) receptor-associated protein